MSNTEIQTTELALDVLGYQEEGGWVALALEMDLRGHGDTFAAALADLKDLVRMQISFALQKGEPEMIWRAAEPVWFKRFAALRADRIRHLSEEAPGDGDEYQIAGLAIPPPHVIAALGGAFTPSNATS